MEDPFVTEVEGEMVHGRSITEIVVEQEDVHPNLEILSVRIIVPVDEAVTATVVSVVEPTIVPFPEIDQE